MTEYRNTGTIYKSFLDAESCIKKYKEKYFYLKSVMELSLFGEFISNNQQESLEKFETFSKKILENLEKNKYFSAKLGLINVIPNAKKCYKNYINGKYGKEFGSLGGAPIGNKNASKNNPETTPDIEEEKDIKNKINDIRDKNIEKDISEENNTPSRSPQGESGVLYIQELNTLKRRGYYGNVVLSQQNINTLDDYLYRNLSTHIKIDDDIPLKALDIIINELDNNIEKGKEAQYNADGNPMQHYIILQQYIKQKLKEENINDFINIVEQLQQGE